MYLKQCLHIIYNGKMSFRPIIVACSFEGLSFSFANCVVFLQGVIFQKCTISIFQCRQNTITWWSLIPYTCTYSNYLACSKSAFLLIICGSFYLKMASLKCSECSVTTANPLSNLHLILYICL